MPEQGPERVKVVTVLVDVRHAGPQTRLQVLGVVAEHKHHHGPRQRRKRRPGVVADGRVQRLRGHDGEPVARLDGDAREGEHDARKDVDDDLLVD